MYTDEKQIRELGLPFESLPPMPRWIYTRKGLQRVPPDWQMLLADVLDRDSLYRPAVFAVLKDYFFGRKRPAHITDESLGATLTRRLNKKMVDELASAMMHGIYAGDIWKLSTPAIMPLPWEIDGKVSSVAAAKADTLAMVTESDANDMRSISQETYDLYINKVHGAMAVYLIGGLDKLVTALETVLKLTGSVEFKTGTEIKELNSLHSEGKVQVRLASMPRS
jgi:protoporphyrinogen oxidase